MIPPSYVRHLLTVNIEKAAFEKRLHLFLEAKRRRGSSSRSYAPFGWEVVIYNIEETRQRRLFTISQSAAGKTLKDDFGAASPACSDIFGRQRHGGKQAWC